MRMTKTKAVVAAIALIVNALSAAFADDVFSGSEVAGLASTVVTSALGVWAVWRVPNKPATPPAQYR